MEYQDAVEKECSIAPDETAKDEDPNNDTPSVQTSVPPHPFKKWVDSFRARKRVPPTIPERYVEGWWDAPRTEVAAEDPTTGQCSPPDQHWEKLSVHSSQLGTVKTTTLSIASQSLARSRGTTQSTTNQSAVDEMRVSGDSTRPTSSSYPDEQAEIRANKRRAVLQELVVTEVDYVLGLKALTGVSFRGLQMPFRGRYSDFKLGL